MKGFFRNVHACLSRMFRINSTGERPVIAFIFLFRVDLETLSSEAKVSISNSVSIRCCSIHSMAFSRNCSSVLWYSSATTLISVSTLNFSCRFWLDFIRLSMRALSIFISNGFVRYPFAPALKHLTWSSTELFAVSINTGIWLVLMSCFIVAQSSIPSISGII